jgi:hypothetical protein
MEIEAKRESPNAELPEAAAFLKVCPRTVLNLEARGLLKTVRFGRRRLFTWASLKKVARTGASLR